MTDDRKIGIWDAYQQQFNPLVVEDGEEYVDLTVSDALDLFMLLIKSTKAYIGGASDKS
jgi:hypothetical protein